MNVENTESFINYLEKILNGGGLVVDNINPNNPQDRILALGVALRGRSSDECACLIEDLFEAADNEQNPGKKEILTSVAVDTMNIAEIILGLSFGGE